MHEILNSLIKNPSQKFQQQLINFEKPQIFSKTPKPRSKCMKCMKNERKRTNTKWFEARKCQKSRGLKV